MTDIPIDFTEITELEAIGISPEYFNSRSITFESDYFVTVRESNNNGQNTVAVVDLKNNNAVTRKTMGGDSALMHISSKIIAVRANGTIVQVFNLETKEKLKSFQMNDPILFWKWLDESNLGLVTATSLYVCNIFDGQIEIPPMILTQRHSNLNNCQIINFVANKNFDWFAVVGITQENDRIAGKIQLFSKLRNISQPIDGHVAIFSTIKLDGNTEPVQVFVTGTRSSTSSSGELRIIEIEHDQSQPISYTKKTLDIFFPPDAINDFPLTVKISEKFGIIYLLTKYGFIHLYELETGTNLFVNRITADSVFVATSFDNGNGLACINKKGQVLTVEISKEKLIPYIMSKLSDKELAFKISKRSGGALMGADDLFSTQFNKLMEEGNYNDAAKIAASNLTLRTNNSTIEKLKNVKTVQGSISPLLIYFSTILDNDKLNKIETIQLAKPLFEQNRKQLFNKWFQEDKLECSEELGDIIKQYDLNMALQCYLKSNIHSKVINVLAELQRYDEILPYCQNINYKPNFLHLISIMSKSNPDKAAEFTSILYKTPAIASELDPEKVADIFYSQNLVQQGTTVLLELLKNDSPEFGHLQTRVLQINLQNSPQVADAILSNKLFSHYDKPTIADLSEKAGLYQRALENYTDIKDIKRCVIHTSSFPSDWLVNYFGHLNVQQSIACLSALLEDNMTHNIQIAVQVATKYSDLLGSNILIKLFEQYNATEGLYYYLTSFVNMTEDNDVVLKYAQAASKLKQFNELERIVKDNNVYDPEKMKNFLKNANLEDQRPLIIVCDRFNFVHELILYLYNKNNLKFIEVYVQQIDPIKTPQVIAALLDVDCDDNFIQLLLNSVVGQVPISELTEEVEKRNRLKILLPFLEKSVRQGNQEQAVYNTLAKIYIDSNNSAEKFLRDNNQYDTLTVGRYCEKRDPYLAYIAYEKGLNDTDLIRITNENGMFKYQARYLLKRSDTQLWNLVLTPENIYRNQVVEAVTSVGILELNDPEPVSLTVQAFMNNNLKMELIVLLEKIVLEPSAFSENTALQGLLFLSAIKYAPNKVRGYIEKLDNYDPNEIGPLCIEKSLNEEAFQIYDRHNMHSEALGVIISNILSLERAVTYVEKMDEPELWSQLAVAQLYALKSEDAIASFIKAGDPSKYVEVIEVGKETRSYESLIQFLTMARKSLREPIVDGALLLSFAQLGRYNDIENLLKEPNVINLEQVGDQLFEEQNYKAAKLCYTNVSNYSKLASTYVYLGDYRAAVESARKASNIKVWKLVINACVGTREFSLAQICGLNLIVRAEDLGDVVKLYEERGYFDELIILFEQGLGLERAHMGMFTELAILYTKYKPEKLSEHLNLFWSRINIPKVIAQVESAHLWSELIFLYSHYDEWDNAALTMLERCAEKFDHTQFKEIIVKVSNLEIYYRAINTYVQEHPSLLIDLLAALTPRLDISRTVKIFANSDNLPLIKPFLINVLPQNNRVVNEAYQDLLIEEEDYKGLQIAVDSHDRYDHLELARRLESHELIYFKRIAASLYAKSKKWDKSLDILIKQKLWKDAIDTAASSQNSEVIEKLLNFFVDSDYKEGFIALLYAAYNIVTFDNVLELSFMNSLDVYVRPYEISVRKEQYDSIKSIKEKIAKIELRGGSIPADSRPLMLTGSTSLSSHNTGF
ncbi:hypothetical protein TBLA_0I03250 [Henningerozyma blattae CBS 6284]|uniref:Clathrin heavy chain n=1 Tax=Henningerozyma blattae (strain ATCC 34711 / CBS 6284 / DSM 70876 / NBRC 10599 / NRRL Y-10934 / UCD 77-7) TaxID=1071380 RepID=I2H9C8_HENB6|nr:hypothetical protein TBLA_0I03250 [Tetrapisispora blattae CBS 6284]CCH62980.1 hypothetical protein TBLA_0I03250 [Tetrapisispora blattae CBS 6284]